MSIQNNVTEEAKHYCALGAEQKVPPNEPASIPAVFIVTLTQTRLPKTMGVPVDERRAVGVTRQIPSKRSVLNTEHAPTGAEFEEVLPSCICV